MKSKLLCAVVLSVSLRLFAGSPADGEFVAHEWGTFTSVQGSDGAQVQWNPFTKTDLPKFVYSRVVPTAQGGQSLELKSLMMSYVRMETPVIYFYSDKDLTADITVEMPQGRITEWYPRATRVGPSFTTNKAEAKEASRSLIEWKGISILPRDTTEISAGTLVRENPAIITTRPARWMRTLCACRRRTKAPGRSMNAIYSTAASVSSRHRSQFERPATAKACNAPPKTPNR
jgi:hypothetical protein